MDGLLRDLRYASRGFLKTPGFTLVALLTLAVGIGGSTAMFAVVNAVLLKPLPFEDADRLMLVHLLVPDRETGTRRENVWSYPKYRTFLEMQDVFADTALFAGRDISLTGDGEPLRLRGEVITERYPSVLGIHPVVGRSFHAQEANVAGEPAVAMIGHALWTRRYGADPAVAGRIVAINAKPYTIVGVLPPGFSGLSGNAEVWIPFAAFEPSFLSQRFAHGYFLVARRNPGVSEMQAIGTVNVLGDRLARDYSESGRSSWGATATSLYSSRIEGDLRIAALILLGAVAALLLIACVNLTNLLIAKAMGRRREIAVRLAIGASRMQIARQFVLEGLLLAAVGTAAGVLVASALLAAAGTLLPESDAFFRMAVSPGAARTAGAQGLTLIGASMIRLDIVSLLVACGIAVVVAGFISLLPALQASGLQVVQTLKASGSSRASGFGGRGVLVTAQISLALVLLAGAGLMLKSAARLHATAIGVKPDGVLTVRIDLPGATYDPDRRVAFFSQLLQRIRSVPGVESVGLANCPPVSGGCSSTVAGFERGRHRVTPDSPSVGVHWATPDYFPALGIRLVRGRLFEDQDRAGRPKVVLVNETAARRFWPTADPVGKTLTLGQGGFEDGAEVVGVVSDVRYSAIEAAADPDAYIPLFQSPPSRVRLFVRSQLRPESLVPVLRGEVAALDPDLPLSEIKTVEQRIGDAMWRTRVAAWLLSAFAGLAVLLTAIGIFGVMSQVVAQETPHIGIRMALGAQKRQVLTLVLGRVVVQTVAGIGIGLPLALAVTRVAEVLLYGVKANDPSTFALVSTLIAAVAIGASCIPALRAARIDPLVALRSE